MFWNKTDYLDYARLSKLESENTSLKFEIDRLTALADRLQTENEQLKNQITNDALTFRPHETVTRGALLLFLERSLASLDWNIWKKVE